VTVSEPLPSVPATGDGPTRSGVRVCHNRPMRLLRMKPGHGEVLLAEGDVEVHEEHELLAAEFRAQMDAGMWAAVPLTVGGGRREAQLVRTFARCRATPTG
jgi:hypothetical protein